MSAVAYVQAQAAGQAGRERLPRLDFWLLGAAAVIVALGLVMVTSASLSIADRVYSDPLHFLVRDLIALALGVTAALALGGIPVAWWERSGAVLYVLGLALLVLVLAVGREVNGSVRWIPLGPFHLQASEFMKIFVVVYMAAYVVRRQDEIVGTVRGFVKPMALLMLACGLLLLEPDFGTAAVLLATALGMLFLGGVPLWQFALLLGTVATSLSALVLYSPYRLDRITAFLDPWADPFKGGFQLTQALIAFGRGDWFGVGLGAGIQKQFYLPEAHTDFLLAVIGEELGLMGTLSVIALFAFLVWRAFQIGVEAERQGRGFAAYVAYGLGLGLGMQAAINIAVNTGLLPTKGLTLPMMSYGGNSLIVGCMMIAMLLRIDYESRRAASDIASEQVRWARV